MLKYLKHTQTHRLWRAGGGAEQAISFVRQTSREEAEEAEGEEEQQQEEEAHITQKALSMRV